MLVRVSIVVYEGRSTIGVLGTEIALREVEGESDEDPVRAPAGVLSDGDPNIAETKQ